MTTEQEQAMVMRTKQGGPRLERTTLSTSRLMEFCSEKELIAQTGHPREDWPIVVLKELMDNALDACEEAEVNPEIHVVLDNDGIEVSDNGPGIPASTIEGVLDFAMRISNREAYVAPDRGAQGNALKTIAAMPFVLDGQQGRLDITAQGLRHEITVEVDQIRQCPVIRHDTARVNGKKGAVVRIWWPDSASSMLGDAEARFLQIAENYSFLNPHLTVGADFFGSGRWKIRARTDAWKKWRPSDPTCAHWYEVEHLTRLIAGYIAHDQDRDSDRTVREFVKEFRGLTSTAKQKAVLDATGLGRVSLSGLLGEKGVDPKTVKSLLEAMRAHSKPVKPAALGIIGRPHLESCFAELGCEMESFQYKKVVGQTEDGLPFVLEAAFGWCENLPRRRIVTGVNWSPGILNPFRQLGPFGRGLDSVLEQQRTGDDEPIAFFLHYARPRVEYTDRGKSAVVVREEDSETIIGAVKGVTARWCKQRKAEERKASRTASRRQVLARSYRTTIKDAAWRVMAEAYSKASNGGRYPAHARQIYYAARPTILEMADNCDRLDSAYFTQTLLPDYMNEYPETTADWDMVFDARGTLIEPHTETKVPLGTLGARKYLQEISGHWVPDLSATVSGSGRFPTQGPVHRYSAILFVEKEGFLPLFEHVKLAEKYDVAIMSTKGMSNTAARSLVDNLCDNIPLLVLHDFDKAGFSILGTLQRDTRRFTFRNAVNVIDLGLRLKDVRQYDLQSECVVMRSDPTRNLRENGATEEEISFLYDKDKRADVWSRGYPGNRVELNAFSSGDLIEWLEAKLEQHGIRKVVPDHSTVERAYRRAVEAHILNDQLADLVTGAEERAATVECDAEQITQEVRELLDAAPTRSWDDAIAEIAENAGEDRL